MDLDAIKACIEHRRNVYRAKRDKWEARPDAEEWADEFMCIEHTMMALDYLEYEIEEAFS